MTDFNERCFPCVSEYKTEIIVSGPGMPRVHNTAVLQTTKKINLVADLENIAVTEAHRRSRLYTEQ